MPYTVYMPRVTQYIRNEDLEKWKALPNKSEFIHNALNPQLHYKIDGKHDPETGIDKHLLVIKANRKGLTVDQLQGREIIKFCKHGFNPKLCKFANPGKPCK